MTMLAVDPYASKVLVKEVHDRLVADIDNFARDAGIQKHWIWTSLKGIASNAEITYGRQFKQHQVSGAVSGLAYVGRDDELVVDDRMAALAGFLLRNFVRAKLMTLSAVLDAAKDGYISDATCLLVPNFFMSKKEGGGLPGWQVNLLLDLLTARKVHGLQTVIYVSDMDAMAQEYGLALSKMVAGNFAIVEL